MNCVSPRWIDHDGELLVVPCGKCLPCLVNKRNDWSFRLMQEYKGSRSAAFITLTYSAKYVPDNGLSKRHVQLFMKRLRKSYGKKLRYYLVGEYGTKTQRPHYHLLLFNFDVEHESFIRSAWSARSGEPFGLVHIGEVTEASIRYCTKYVIQRGGAFLGTSKSPFALMSRAYGLGANYLTDQMISWHRGGSIREMTAGSAKVFTMQFGVKGRLPRYYKDKIWPLVKGTHWEYIRKQICDLTGKEVIKSELENVRLVREAGYANPDAIIAEMRSAVISRIKEKVSFTQTI